MNGIRGQKKLEYVLSVSQPIGIEEKNKRLSSNFRKSNGRLIDETGKKYGMLLVIEYAGSGKELKNGSDGGAVWRCRCDCGKETIALGTRLRRGIHRSCGNHWVKPTGEGSFNAMYRVRVDRAKRRGIEWKLTKKQVSKVSKLPCFYCGLPPSNIANGSANGIYEYSGIDRIDSKKGYEIGNIVPCCADCNKSKLTKTLDEFLAWFKRIANYNKWGCNIENIKFNRGGELAREYGLRQDSV